MIALNGQEVKMKTFPNGESHVDGEQLTQLYKVSEVNIIDFKYHNDGDLIKLLFVKRFLDRFVETPMVLRIAYMPYSRMDRVEGDSVFTLKYVSEFINDMCFNQVVIAEPHSDVTPALIEHAMPVYPTQLNLHHVLQHVGFDTQFDYLFFPDAGAQKRYSSLRGFNQIVGFKKRNFQTGEIESLQVVGEMEPGHKVLILDDLCSYGGTFMRSAKELRKLGARDVQMFVAHCEDSIHEGDILKTDDISRVYTTDSILTKPHDKITLV